MKIYTTPDKNWIKDEKKLLLLLEDDPTFEKIIKSARNKVGLPEEGISAEITPDKRIKILETDPDIIKKFNSMNYDLLRSIRSIMNCYQLPPSWLNTMYSIITLNIAVVPMRDSKGYMPIEITYNGGLSRLFRRVSENKYEFQSTLEITVREGMSFDSLMKSLHKQKPTIDKYLSYLHKTPKIKSTNIKIKKEILALSKTLNDNEISKYLEDKYGEELSFDPSYNTVSKYRDRYKKEIAKIPKNKYSLLFLDELLDDGQ